jgi:hypothetical protein
MSREPTFDISGASNEAVPGLDPFGINRAATPSSHERFTPGDMERAEVKVKEAQDAVDEARSAAMAVKPAGTPMMLRGQSQADGDYGAALRRLEAAEQAALAAVDHRARVRAGLGGS